MRGNRALLTTVVTAAAVGATAVVTALNADAAAAGCRVSYTLGGSWAGGFTANVAVTNTGDAINSWRLTWTFPDAGQRVTNGWNATFTQSGTAVTATNAAWNGPLGTGASASIGFNGTSTGSNPVPTSFALNGVACNGAPATPTTAPTTAPATTQPTTRPPTTPPVTTAPPTSNTALIGFGAQNGGVTGGGSAAAQTVTSSAALTTAAGATAPAVIRVSGTINCTGMIRVRSDKTIVGVGANATLAGCGLTVNGNRNVLIRNLNFRGWSDDAVNVENSTNVWVDHNTFGKGYDGVVDVKRGSDFVTVSWNKVSGHDKTMLLGHSDDNGAQDTGHLRVSYHHNWFDGTNQRHPRVRFANPVHVFNNYYANIGSYGVASTMNAGVLVEGNYFENVRDPFHRGEGDSGPGGLVARNNHLVNSGSGSQGGSVAAIPYRYTLDNAAQVKAIVQAGAGAGRI